MAQTVKNLQCGRPGFDPWVGKIPWRRAWQPTPVFLPGESPWAEEHGGLQSTGSERVRHHWIDLSGTHVEGMSWILRSWHLLDHYWRCWASSDTSLGVSWASDRHQVSETSCIGQGEWDSDWFLWSFPTLSSWSPGQANLLWVPCPQSVALRNGMSVFQRLGSFIFLILTWVRGGQNQNISLV